MHTLVKSMQRGFFMGKRQLERIMTALILAGAFYVGRLGAQMMEMHNRITQAVSGEVKEYRVVIDAGHGGFDSGKVGIGNILEKEINLAIAGKVQQNLEAAGIETIMTRESDRGLYDENEENKKQQDMKKRCTVINESGADLAVSIHQNSYTEEYVCGPQVFYYETSQKGKELAQTLQEALNQKLDIARPREIKANNTYYILKKTQIPTVIAECGFLSNTEEAEKLISENYQEQVAEAICEGIRKYLRERASVL